MIIILRAMQYVLKRARLTLKVDPYTPCIYVNDADLKFTLPDKAFVVAIVFNGAGKPLRKAGMIFPVNDAESYVYKRSIIDRLLCRKGKLAIPPRSARAALLTIPINEKLAYVSLEAELRPEPDDALTARLTGAG